MKRKTYVNDQISNCCYRLICIKEPHSCTNTARIVSSEKIIIASAPLLFEYHANYLMWERCTVAWHIHFLPHIPHTRACTKSWGEKNVWAINWNRKYFYWQHILQVRHYQWLNMCHHVRCARFYCETKGWAMTTVENQQTTSIDDWKRRDIFDLRRVDTKTIAKKRSQVWGRVEILRQVNRVLWED